MRGLTTNRASSPTPVLLRLGGPVLGLTKACFESQFAILDLGFVSGGSKRRDLVNSNGEYFLIYM
ncbi:hypothetical protein Taro_038006 [Colocasia esculenta]|uniref:Uncharacterized protein n=1 Tax=Colocasia esculenta TaxID=4460 RepID=A0A843WBH4_COLES|nr:hypothetical protein [Colocasia esculenta]